MLRLLALTVNIALCTALLCGCVGLPFVLSEDPFYPEDDPGVAVPELVGSGWLSQNNEQLTIEADSGTKQPGDYLLTFTRSMRPEPGTAADDSPQALDAS